MEKVVLIIDDDPDLCNLLDRALRKLFLSIECAHSLHEARQKIEEFTAFFVLLDHNLPDGMGLYFIQVIKEKHDCKVVLMSADPAPLMERIAIKRGAHAFIAKPFSVADIRDMVSHAMGN